jgi:hypothetical protein
MSPITAPRVLRIAPAPRSALAIAAAMALIVPTARGMWAVLPREVPVDRLLENANRYVREHPEEAHGYYVLGQLHSMAFATGADRLQVSQSLTRKGQEEDAGAPPRFLPWESILVLRANRPTTPALREHLRDSIRNYRKATDRDHQQALTWLGLGWVLEEASTLEEPFSMPDQKPSEPLEGATRARVRGLLIRLGGAPTAERDAAAEALARQLPAALPLLAEAAAHAEPEARARIAKVASRYWQDQALTAYRLAYELSLENDLKRSHQGPEGNSMISLDAVGSIRRILGRRTLTAAERAELGRMEGQTKGLPRGMAITPLIFSMEAARPLEDLLDPSLRVSFDLAGDGRPDVWPWLRPGTALLVWDPAGTGRISSGRQLFGSVTWWIFWRHGYEPLTLLDDDGDGWVAGRELAGLAVWRDRNGDGHSDPGEVIPAARAGIARLAARPDGRYGRIPWNPHGLATTDGRLLPTYDWTPTPLERTGPGKFPPAPRLPRGPIRATPGIRRAVDNSSGPGVDDGLRTVRPDRYRGRRPIIRAVGRVVRFAP